MKRVKKTTKEFYVHKGNFDSVLGEDRAYVVERKSGSIIGSCRVRRPIKQADEYTCNSLKNNMLEKAEAEKQLAEAERAPAWGEQISKGRYSPYTPLAKKFKELTELVRKVHEIFKKRSKISDKDEHYILSQHHYDTLYKPKKNDLRRFPVYGKLAFGEPIRSWHLLQSGYTFKRVLTILFSAVAFSEDLVTATGSEDAASQFYRELEDNLRYALRPIREELPEEWKDRSYNTSSNYLFSTDVITRKHIVHKLTDKDSDLVYIGKSATDGIIKRLEQWQKTLEEYGFVDDESPKKLMTLKVATVNFRVSERTLLRLIRDGTLISYRPPDAHKKEKHMVDAVEVARRYNRRT